MTHQSPPETAPSVSRVIWFELPTAPATAPGCVIYVEVPDLAVALEAADASGGSVAEGRRTIGNSPDGGVYATVTDPAGNRLGLWSPT